MERSTRVTCLVWMLFIAGCHVTPVNMYRPERPNILFILADDLGWNDIGYHNPQVLTPHLDSLARDGVILNKAYVQNLCTPSRAAILTGKYPYKTGMQNLVVRVNREEFLPRDPVLLPERLRAGGYTTHLVGKWHLGSCRRDVGPIKRGYDTFLGVLSGYNGYFNKKRRYTFFSDTFILDFRYGESIIRNTSDDQSTTDFFTHRTQQLIQQHDRTKPFFISLHYTIPHFPLQVNERFFNLYPNVEDRHRRIYLGMVSTMDESVGQVIQTLREEGYMDNTLVVFQSDNGGSLTAGGSNLPLRGTKGDMYEGSHRVPTFVYAPGLIYRQPRISNSLFHAVDWMPTLLSAANLPPVPETDGKNQWDMIRYGFKGRRQIFIYNINQKPEAQDFKTAAIRVGSYKLITGNPQAFPLNLTLVLQDTVVRPSSEPTDTRTKRSPFIRRPYALRPNYYRSRSRFNGRRSYQVYRRQFKNPRKSYLKKNLDSDNSDLQKIMSALEKLNEEMDLRFLRKIRANNVGRIMDLLASYGPECCASPVPCECELYNLIKDPLERNNLSSDLPVVVRFLTILLNEFAKDEVDPVTDLASGLDPRSAPELSDFLVGNRWCENE